MPAAASLRYESDADDTSAAISEARRLNFPNFARHHEAEPQQQWQVDVQRHLVRLVAMKTGWDSYNAPPLRRDAGFFAIEILHSIMRPRTPAPQVVPSSAGGIQLEWHEKGIDLEIHVTGPYECELWFQDHRDPASPPPLAIALTDDLSVLQRPIHLLTSR